MVRFSPWLLCAGLLAQESRVVDLAGLPVPNAAVRIRSPFAGGPVLKETRTGTDGRFSWPALATGPYVVRVEAQAFTAIEELVRWDPAAPPSFTLQPESVYTRLTVTATRGAVEESEQAVSVSFVKDRADIQKRPAPTLGNALAEEPGVLVQQSTSAQVSPFLRGLTGYQVLNVVDGVRFNNSTFRSGPNQYLAYVEPGQVQRMEAVLGPASTQFGSDALGGAIQVLTQEPRFADGRGWSQHGELMLGAASADLSTLGSGRWSASNEKLFFLLGASGRRHGDLRPGGGWDSRNVFTKLFGLSQEQSSALLSGTQQDSGFRQYGVEGKFAARLRPDQLLTVYYQRGVQDQVRGYKDLLGGLGRMVSTFDPQVLDWLYARYEKTNFGFLDSWSGTFSANSQQDGGMRQNLRRTDPITTDWSRATALGYSTLATLHHGTRWLGSFGGEFYDERVRATRDVRNPVSGAVTRPRPLYPDRSRYGTLGVFGQGSVDVTRSLRLSGGLRYTGIRFATVRDAAFGIPDSSQWFRDVTFQSSVRWQLAPVFGLHFVASRGFRAPNLNDLGALGLNDLGYEVPASDAIPNGALLATDAGETATSVGRRLTSLRAESLMNYEAGARFTTRRVTARVQAFHADLYDPIVRRTLLFPAGAVPASLAGQPVTAIAPTAAQRAQGVVTVATALDPRSVKSFVNDGQSRYYGIESMGRLLLTNRWSIEANYTFLAGRDLFPNRFIRRLPPQMGAATLRYNPTGRRPWWEVSIAASGAQSRLSGGDRDDERIGASRRRSDIAAFFQGSRVAPLLDAAGRFTPTGETLSQIQDRVLPLGATINGVRVADNNSRVPLYLSTAGWATVGFRGGIPLSERLQLLLAVENLLDRNYRVHGSGVDSAGVNGYLSLRWQF